MDFEIHDLNALFSLTGLRPKKIDFTGKLQLVYILFPQQSTTHNKIPVNQILSFKYFFITQT